MKSVVPRMQAVEGAGGSSAVVRRIAAVGEPDAVPAFAQAAVAATLSAAARQEFVRPPVLMPGIAVDSAVQAATVVPLLPVVVTEAVAAQAVLPSARTGFPGSWPFSAAQASRQSSSGPAAWHKVGPVREPSLHPYGFPRQSLPQLS